MHSLQNKVLGLVPQQSPPSNIHPALFVSSSQYPSPIQSGWVLSQPNIKCKGYIDIEVS